MRTLTRQVLLELMQVFLLTLAGLTALVFIALIGKEAVKKGLGVGPLLRMTPYLLPQAMQFAVPGALLLATTNVYGRLSSSNEILAIRSMGVSPWVLARPTLVLAALVSLGAVALNDLAVSWGRLGVQRVFIESLEEVIYSQLRLHRSYAEGGIQINVRRVEGKRLVQPTVTVQSRGETPPWTVSSASAEILSAPDANKLLIRFEGVELEGLLNAAIATTFQREIDLDDLLGDDASRRPSNFAMAEIGAERSAVDRKIETIQRDQATRCVLALASGDFGRLAGEEHRRGERAKRLAEKRLRRLEVEPYRRWANGFSCLCFVLVGMPMAILRQKGEFLASFFLCFLPILIAYYPLLIVSVDLAKGGDAPPMIVWIGNGVLAVWGLAMMARVVRR